MTDESSSEQSRAEQLLKLGQLSMRSERDGGTHTIVLAGELDLATANDVERELLRVEATDAVSILVDLSGLTFIDSSGIRLLVLATGRARADSNRLKLRRPCERVLHTMRICGVDSLLPFS